jgi:hypothetical protein
MHIIRDAIEIIWVTTTRRSNRRTVRDGDQYSVRLEVTKELVQFTRRVEDGFNTSTVAFRVV